MAHLPSHPFRRILLRIEIRNGCLLTAETHLDNAPFFCEVGLLLPKGERKMRTYEAAPVLLEARRAIRLQKVLDDPYELVARRFKRAAAKEMPRLPGL